MGCEPNHPTLLLEHALAHRNRSDDADHTRTDSGRDVAAGIVALVAGSGARVGVLDTLDVAARMRVLVACEESQVVTKAFRALGHEAYSCDILPCSGGLPVWHIQEDIQQVASADIDLLIAFPPCTHLASSGARWFKEKLADGRQQDAIEFFFSLVLAAVPLIAIENPIGIMSTHYRKPDQIIQPWQFGHGETKATCLWLKGLPPLVPTNIVEGREARIHRMAPSPERSKLRSKTYPGIAEAMAQQWGGQITLDISL